MSVQSWKRMPFLRCLSTFLLIWLASNARADGVPDDCTQLMLAIAPTWNSMRGELRLFERPRGGEWKVVAGPFPVLFGKNGLAWGTGISGQNEPGLRKKERDGRAPAGIFAKTWLVLDRKSTRLNSSHQIISYAVFCLKNKNQSIAVQRTHQHFQADT